MLHDGDGAAPTLGRSASGGGCLLGLALLAAELGCGVTSLLAETERMVHGTTVATNALLEGLGAAGYRSDVLLMQSHGGVALSAFRPRRPVWAQPR